MAEMEHFDYIILGTGIVESILASRLSHIPEVKILHVDLHPYYAQLATALPIKDSLVHLVGETESGTAVKAEGKHTEQDDGHISNLKLSYLERISHDDGAAEDEKRVESSRLPQITSSDIIEAYQTGALHKLFSTALSNIESIPTKFTGIISMLLGKDEKQFSSSDVEKIVRGCASVFKDNDTPVDTQESPEPIELETIVNRIISTVELDDGRVIESSTILRLVSILDFLINMDKLLNNFEPGLSPKLMMCSDEMVRHLVETGVGNYVEFKTVDALYFLDAQRGNNIEKLVDSLVPVPTAKEQVFNNKAISLLDKRRLTKVLTDAMAFEAVPLEENINIDTPKVEDETNISPSPFNTFDEYLLSLKFKDPVIMNSIIYGIVGSKYSHLNVDEKISYKEGMSLLSRFVGSLGKWGNTPYLASNFGLYNELVQAYCRNAAVFGAVYLLNYKMSQLSSIEKDNDTNDKYVISGSINSFSNFNNEEQDELKFSTSNLIVSDQFISSRPDLFTSLITKGSLLEHKSIQQSRTGLILDGNFLESVKLFKQENENTEIIEENGLNDVNSKSGVSVIRIPMRLEGQEGSEVTLTLVQNLVYKGDISFSRSRVDTAIVTKDFKTENATKKISGYADVDFYYVYITASSDGIDCSNEFLESQLYKFVDSIVEFGKLKENRKQFDVVLKISYNENSLDLKSIYQSYSQHDSKSPFVVTPSMVGGDTSGVLTLEDSVTFVNKVIDHLGMTDKLREAEAEFKKQMEKSMSNNENTE